jgi:signal recognition particle receptor subunit beta
MESLKDLQSNLKEYGKNIFKIPLVMQFNKRDLAEQGIPLMAIDRMQRDLNRQLKVPSFEGSAVKGTGVGVTLKECLKLTLQALQKEFKWANK